MKKHVTLFSSVLMMSTTLLGAGGVFADDITPTPADKQTSVSTVLSIDTSEKPTLPGGTTDGNDHDNNNTTGPFGIAYQPKSLSGSETLNASGNQEIDLANNSSVDNHVGVKDLTRQKHEWTLTAQLSWDGNNSSYMTGATVKLAGGEVKKNNKGSLEELNDQEVTGQQTVNIQTSATAEVMKSVKNKTQNGVYDYKFTSAKLAIPNVENVPADTYSGNINWNLALTPTMP
ncbi:WxL domain-containing protein [Enterococcus faecium]|nr:WxL domain-containing protein [Enterococcus faecium]MDQ8586486.1 WxL domain-containing protein [Enterococcus faecium]